MANIQSAKKSIRQTKKRTLDNYRMRRRMRRTVRLFEDLLEKGDFDKAKEQLSRVSKVYDKAAKKGVIKKNTASRKKSRLAKMYNITTANVKTAERSS